MSIKYNQFGEVVSVNGLTTGQHLGTPMQDAAAKKPEDNEAYSEEVNTVSRVENVIDDKQPTSSNGNGGNGGGGVSSWNDLTDKPFGEEEFVNLYTVENGAFEDSMGNGMFVHFTPALELHEGEICYVLWKNAEYQTAVKIVDGMVGFGNVGLITGGEDTGEPFVYADMGGAGIFVDIFATEPTTCDISIRKKIVSKIPEEWMPDNKLYEVLSVIDVEWDGDVTDKETVVVGDYTYCKVLDDLSVLHASDLSDGYCADLYIADYQVPDIKIIDAKYKSFASVGMDIYVCDLSNLCPNAIVAFDSGKSINIIGESATFNAGLWLRKDNLGFIAEIKIYKIVQGISGGVLFEPAGIEISNARFYGLVLKSSTAGSIKQFRITVDDTGALKAEEV